MPCRSSSRLPLCIFTAGISVNALASARQFLSKRSLPPFISDNHVFTIWTKKLQLSRSFTAIASINNTPKETVNSPLNVLTLLHKTSSFLPRVLPPKEESNEPTVSLEFWNDVLTNAYNDLSSNNERKTRVVVFGVDEWSGSRELITALLEEPFASDDGQNDAIRSRWTGHDNMAERTLTIEPETYPYNEKDNILRSTSSWFQGFTVPIQIIELFVPSGKPVSEFISHTLSNADILILVCNPLTTSLEAVFQRIPFPSQNSTIILVISSTTSISPLSADIVSALNGHSQVLIVDPCRALAALRALKRDTSSPVSIQRYQDDFIGSQVSTVTDTVSKLLKSSERHTVLNQIRQSLSACNISLRRAECEIDTVCSGVSELLRQVEEARIKVPIDIFGSDGGNIVTEALTEGRKEMESVMNELTWWRTLWRIDEISAIIGAAIERAWCRDLEKTVIFQTGRLSVLQQSLASSTLDFLSSISPASPLRSHILINNLKQLASSPTFPLTPTSLTSPLRTRLAQLQYPTTRLHLVAQRSALGMCGFMAGGMGISWAGWAGALGLAEVNLETWVCVSMFSILVGARWAVGRWERGKKMWWQDWERVCAGLDRDLKASLNVAIEDQVVVVPVHATKGLDELVRKRKAEVEEVKADLNALRAEANKAKGHP